MLRRKPTRVEDRADVADEYATYVQEKQQRESGGSLASQGQGMSLSQSQSQSDAQRQSQTIRQQTRARIGMGAFATQ